MKRTRYLSDSLFLSLVCLCVCLYVSVYVGVFACLSVCLPVCMYLLDLRLSVGLMCVCISYLSICLSSLPLSLPASSSNLEVPCFRTQNCRMMNMITTV